MFEDFANFMTYNLLHYVEGTPQAAAVHFFFYDSLKIIVLIFAVVSVIEFLKTFISQKKLKRWMEKSKYGIGNLIAAFFGAVTPFCSCSSIPIFMGFLKANVPLGIALSFIITSPLVNEVAFVIMGGMFGWWIAATYAVTGILLGTLVGLFMGKLNLEDQISISTGRVGDVPHEEIKGLKNKLKHAFKEAVALLKKLTPYVLLGVAVGALIHGFVPAEFFVNYVQKYSAFSVPIAVILGVPIYAGCSMIVPLIFSITANGVPLGTSLAFMMAIAGVSLPEAIILKKVMKTKLLVLFFSFVSVGIIIIGYLFNFLESKLEIISY